MSDFSKDTAMCRFIYRLSALGDVALVSGVLEYWHRAHGWRFVVATAGHLAPLFEHHPAVDELVPLRKDDLRGISMLKIFRKLAREYKGTGLIDLHGSLRSQILRLLWKGDVQRYPKFSIERRAFLKSRGVEARARLNAMNVTQRYAMAVEDTPPPAAALRPKIYLSATEIEQGRQTVSGIFDALSGLPGLPGRHDLPDASDASGLRGCGPLKNARPVILHPYATHSRKMWPRENWLALIDELDRAGIFWLLVGQDEPLLPRGPHNAHGEQSDSRELRDSCDPRDLCDLTNRTSLRELCAVLQQGCLMVTGDSGPMHLASAVDLPVLALFGPTTREWGFFPAGEHDRVLELDLPCRPCSLHGGTDCPHNADCLRGISVDNVMKHILERVQG